MQQKVEPTAVLISALEGHEAVGMGQEWWDRRTRLAMVIATFRMSAAF